MAVFRARPKDPIDVDFVAGAALQLASCHMADDRRMRIFDRRHESLRLFLLWHLEAAMYARDNEVEVIQGVVWVVQRSIRQDIRFNTF